jgi:hypothetical protein
MRRLKSSRDDKEPGQAAATAAPIPLARVAGSYLSLAGLSHNVSCQTMGRTMGRKAKRPEKGRSCLLLGGERGIRTLGKAINPTLP